MVNEVSLVLPEDEALALYGHLHRSPGGQDQYCETYRQLQAHFFQTLTVEQLTRFLGEES